MESAARTGERLEVLAVPAARVLPSSAEYLAHLDLADADRSLIRLASNENTELPSPRVRKALQDAYDVANLSPPTMPPLRLALAERYAVDPGRILLSAGSTEVIDATFRTFVRAGDEVVLARPSWPVYRRRLEALEARIVEVPLVVTDTAYAYDVDALVGAVTRRTKLVVVCTPNNPTGNAMRNEDVQRVARLGPPLLLDAAYADFDPGVDLRPIVHEHDNVVLTRTFSKAYCLAGLRIGYAVGGLSLLDLVDRFLVPGSSVSSAGLNAALAALEDDAYHRRQVKRIVAERDRLIAALRTLGVRAYDSCGNFVAIDASAHEGGSHGLAATLLEHGIVVRPLADGILRVTVGRERENDAVLAALTAVAGAAR